MDRSLGALGCLEDVPALMMSPCTTSTPIAASDAPRPGDARAMWRSDDIGLVPFWAGGRHAPPCVGSVTFRTNSVKEVEECASESHGGGRPARPAFSIRTDRGRSTVYPRSVLSGRMDSPASNRPASVDAILEATRRVIAERGPDKISMSAVAARAGVSRPTLYRWFPSKDALLGALSDYERERFHVKLQSVIDAQSTPARRLDAALWCLVTYLDGLMGPDPIGADPGYALQSLTASIGPQTASLVRILGDALDAVPAVRLGHMSREQAAELFLRITYSHYLVPHGDPAALLESVRSLAGMSVSSLTSAEG